MKTALYRRVSTDHQDGSLQVQEQRVLEYTRYKTLETDPHLTFADPDTSGSIALGERDGGRALLGRLKHGDVKHLVIAKLDRLGRNTRDFLTNIDTFNQLGITLHIADFGGDSISTNGHWGRMILTILAAVAEAELGEIRDRVQKRMDLKFKQGSLTGSVPYGWDCRYTFTDGHAETRAKAAGAAELATLESCHGRVQTKTMVDNPEEQNVIRLMAQWRGIKLRVESGGVESRTSTSQPSTFNPQLSGGSQPSTLHPQLSYKAIADRLNANHVPGKQGGRWQCGQVDSVLKSKPTRQLLSNELRVES